MGIKGSKNQEPAKPTIVCGGCEKVFDNEEELSPYIGKKYCKACIKAIKDNNRRTMGTIKKTVSGETATSDPGTSTAPPTNNQEEITA